MGKPLIMGRKTLQAIGKPLDGRDNIVVSAAGSVAVEGVLLARSIDAALAIARERASARGVDEIMIIGGGAIYKATRELADRIYLTLVHANPEGDTFFELPDPGVWREVSREAIEPGPKDDHPASLLVLERALQLI